MSQKRNLTSTSRTGAAIAVLASLSRASAGRVPADQLAAELSLSERQLDEVIALLQLLADSRSGARCIIYRDGDDIVLEGEAARMAPMRLTEDEAAAVHLLLSRYHIDENTREGIERALDPDEFAAISNTMAADPLFGEFYQFLFESIQDGVRVIISYRSEGEATARRRIVDPGFFEAEGDKAYLVAWDVEKDAQRRYRTEKIEEALPTEESVLPHNFKRVSTAESLLGTARRVYVRFPSSDALERAGWAGIDRENSCVAEDGGVVAPVAATDLTWLFDAILSSPDSIHITGPESAITEFRRYAERLLESSYA